MKNLLLLAALALTATACGTKGYTISGIVADSTLNGQTAYLKDASTEQPTTIDSAIITDGKFQFKGVAADSLVTFYIVSATPRMSAVVIPENTDITLEFTEQGPKVNSDKLNATLGGYYAARLELKNQVDKIVDSLQTLYATDRHKMMEEYQKIVGDIEAKDKANAQKILDENKDNLLGVFMLNDMLRSAETLKAFDSLSAISPKVMQINSAKAARQGLVNFDNTQNGKMFADFQAQNPDGSAAKLSDYVGKGKYVLVDFWASWCGPCKREIPNLKMINDNYKDLVVLGVNVWDAKEPFTNTVAAEGMAWPQIYASENQAAPSAYGIKGIPTIILFAPDGTIVDRTLRDTVMIAKIAELFPAVKIKK